MSFPPKANKDKKLKAIQAAMKGNLNLVKQLPSTGIQFLHKYKGEYYDLKIGEKVQKDYSKNILIWNVGDNEELLEKDGKFVIRYKSNEKT